MDRPAPISAILSAALLPVAPSRPEWSNQTMAGSFDELVAEANSAPIDGWDFSWLNGRATEERPSWRYSELVASRVPDAGTVVDLQSGGGEMLSRLPTLPVLLVGTEGWAPNLAVAVRRLRPLGAFVVATHDDPPALAFRDGSVDLVTSRHSIVTWWEEVARILRPGGSLLSQQVGRHSVGELTEYFLGPNVVALRIAGYACWPRRPRAVPSGVGRSHRPTVPLDSGGSSLYVHGVPEMA